MASGQSREHCPSCGSSRGVVFVHGHGQCVACGTNTEPCCAGASALNEVDGGAEDAPFVDPQLFERLFAQLGGAKATVTTDALLFALVQSQGSDLDTARLLLEAGERVGVVQRVGENCHRLWRI
jgi:hypothetical protein